MDLAIVIQVIHGVLWLLPRLRTPITILRRILYVVSAITIPSILFLLASPVLLAAVWSDFRGWAATSGSQHFLATSAVTMVAAAFFAVRQSHKAIYGTAETLVGVFGCWASVTNPTSDRLLYSLALCSSVYIVVRGFTNISDGLKEKPKQSFLDRAQERLETLERSLSTFQKPSASA